MAKFELTVSDNYVSEWGYLEGIRELFQNAIDQEVENKDNKMFIDYDEKRKVLSIGNKTSVLGINTLLFGGSTKVGKEGLIGKFGEGYKLGTLALTREGHEVVFYNYGAREVWRPKFVNSRRYGARVLTFFVDKKYVWQRVPNNNLVIEISNITKEQYGEIKESNLHLQELKQKTGFIDTGQGRILLGDKHKGRVYVNGLYINTNKNVDYGYDLLPEDAELDRDRRMVSGFNLSWTASKMWKMVQDEYLEEIKRMVVKGSKDIQYIDSFRGYEQLEDTKDLGYEVSKDFIDKYGDDAVPVTSQEEFETVRRGYKPVVVTEIQKQLIKDSGVLKNVDKKVILTAKERLDRWINKYSDKMTEEMYTEIRDIYSDME